jgi:hypothetical protein
MSSVSNPINWHAMQAVRGLPKLPPLDHGMFQLELLCSAFNGSDTALRSPAAGQRPAPRGAHIKAEGGTGSRPGGTPAAVPAAPAETGGAASPLDRKRWRAEADAALGLAAGADSW